MKVKLNLEELLGYRVIQQTSDKAIAGAKTGMKVGMKVGIKAA